MIALLVGLLPMRAAARPFVLLLGDSPASTLMRWLVPASLLVPRVVGVLRLLAKTRGGATDAMTTHRLYRPALSVPEALEECAKQRGRQFAPDVVDALLLITATEFDALLPARCKALAPTI